MQLLSSFIDYHIFRTGSLRSKAPTPLYFHISKLSIFMRNFLVMIISCMCQLSLLMAQWTNNTLENTLISDQVGIAETNPLSVTISNGKTYITFFKAVGNGYELRMQFLDANGFPLWDTEGIRVGGSSSLEITAQYDLEADLAGNAIISFQDLRSSNDGLGFEPAIAVWKVDQEGNFLWGTEGILLHDDQTPYGGSSPEIGITAANNVIIAWLSYSPAGGNSNWISISKISPQGSMMWQEIKRIEAPDNPSLMFSTPRIIPTDTDGFIIQYIQTQMPASFDGLPVSHLFASRYNTQGNPIWPAPVLISTRPVWAFTVPWVVSDEHDGYFVAFDSTHPLDSNYFDAYLQHIGPGGNIWSPTGVALADSVVNKWPMDIVHDRNSGDTWVLLKYEDNNNDYWGIRLQRVSASGNRLLGNEAKIIFPMDDNLYHPVSLTNCQDGLILIFSEGYYAVNGIKASKISYEGNPLWSAPIDMCTNQSPRYEPITGVITNHQLVIVWAEFRHSFDESQDAGVYAQNISCDGRIGLMTSTASDVGLQSLQIFPNPARFEELQLDMPAAGRVQLQLIDAVGQQLRHWELTLSEGVNPIPVSRAGLQPGMYLLRVIKEEQTEILRLLLY